MKESSTMIERHTFHEAFVLLLKIQAPKSPNTFAQTKCVVSNLKWFADNVQIGRAHV